MNYKYNDSPGPGSYKFNGSVGKQIYSTAPTEPSVSFAKAKRTGYNVNDSPGPGAYSDYYYRKTKTNGYDFGTGDREAFNYMYWK